MNLLDMRTIVFTTLVTNVICMLIVFLLWHRNRHRYDGLFFNVLDFVCQAAGLFLLFIRSPSHGWPSIVATNTIILTGTLLGFVGLERFTGNRGRQAHNVFLIGLFAVIHTWFCWIEPDLAMRNLNLCAFWLIIGLQCFWLLVWRVDRAMRPVTLGVALVYGALNLLNAARIAHVLVWGGAVQDWFRAGAFETYILLCYKLIIILLTYTLVLMVNKRLLIEVERQEEKFSKAFHSSPYGVVLTRLSDGKIFEANEGYEKITGYQHAEMCNRTTTELRIWPTDEDRSAFVAELSAKGVVHDVETKLLNKSGQTRTVVVSSEILTIHGRDTVLTTVNDVTGRKLAEQEREKLIDELREALSRVKTLSGLLPICSSCKKIRNDSGYWEHIEQYICDHSDADFSHGVCPDCARRLYPEIFGTTDETNK